MSNTTIGIVGLVVLVVWAVGESAAVVHVRRRVHRIEYADEDITEKVHRLQRLALAITGGWMVSLVIFGSGIAALGSQGSHTAHSTGDHVAGAIVGAVIALLLLVPLFLMMRSVRGALRRIRRTSKSLPNRGRRAAAGLCIGVAYAAILVGGGYLVPRHGAAHAAGMFAVYVVAIFLLASVLTPLIFVRLVTAAMPESAAKPLRELADQIGVHVRGFRTMKTRSQKVANAMQTGTLPGLRYVIVTDYLADHLEPDQLAAVVAHELGHARRHHVLRKLAITFGTLAVAEGVLIGVGHVAGASHLVRVLIAPLFLLLPVSLIISQGVFGVRFEKQADDIAARYVGNRELAAALRCLGELNHTKRDTGRAWSILTQHPGLQERLERLGAGDRRRGNLQPS